VEGVEVTVMLTNATKFPVSVIAAFIVIEVEDKDPE
jgi:hypothetical protein